jgi:hypothetical protein
VSLIKAIFNCETCANKKYCAALIQSRTREVCTAIGRHVLPAPAVEKEAPAGVIFSAFCGLKTGQVSFADISSARCAHGVEWDLCDVCQKRRACAGRAGMDRWAAENKAEVEQYLQAAAISAPWLVSFVTCKNKTGGDTPGPDLIK